MLRRAGISSPELLTALTATLLLLGAHFLSPAMTWAVPPDGNQEFPVGVLFTRGEAQIEGRMLVLAQRKSASPLIYAGNKIEVSEGDARLEFLMGGRLTLCRGSRLSVQQNHSPYLIVLDKGTLSFNLPESQGDVFFTPDFMVRTELDGRGARSPFRGDISLDELGVICVRSIEGNLRISSQRNNGFLILPAGASIKLSPGEISQNILSTEASCKCIKPSKYQDMLLSLQSHSNRSRLSKVGSLFKKVLHVLTLGLK